VEAPKDETLKDERCDQVDNIDRGGARYVGTGIVDRRAGGEVSKFRMWGVHNRSSIFSFGEMAKRESKSKSINIFS